MKNFKRFLALILCFFLVVSCYNYSFSTPNEANAIVGVDDAALILAGANLAYAAGQLGIKLDQAHAVDHMINLRQKMTDVKFRVICGALMAGRMTYKQLYNLGADLFDYVEVSKGGGSVGGVQISGSYHLFHVSAKQVVHDGKIYDSRTGLEEPFAVASDDFNVPEFTLFIGSDGRIYNIAPFFPSVNTFFLHTHDIYGPEIIRLRSSDNVTQASVKKGDEKFYLYQFGLGQGSYYDQILKVFGLSNSSPVDMSQGYQKILDTWAGIDFSSSSIDPSLKLNLTKRAENILKSTGHTKDGTELTDQQKRDWLQKSTGVYNPDGTNNIVVNNNYYDTYGGTNNAVNWIAGVKDLDTGLYVPALPVIGEDGSISVPSDAVPVAVDSDGKILNPDNPIILPRDLFGIRDLTGNPDISIPGDIAIPGNPDIPMNPAIPDVTVPSVDLPTPDGSKPSIGLYKYFPFSLPWDTYRLSKALIAQPRAPSFTFDMGSMGSVWKNMGSMSGGIKGLFLTSGHTVTVSLSAFDKLAEIFRILMDLLFIIGLTVGAHSHIHGGD